MIKQLLAGATAALALSAARCPSAGTAPGRPSRRSCRTGSRPTSTWATPNSTSGECTNVRLVPTGQPELFKEKTRLEADAGLSAQDKAGKLDTVNKKLAELQRAS